jgi:hypothetical protein
VVSTDSRLLFQALDGIYDDLGFGALADDVFRDLVLARVVEPISVLDAGRVLADLGRKAASDKTMRRTLARCADRGYRDRIAGLCLAHARASGDISLVLYDVTTLLCRHRHNRFYADLLVMPMFGVFSQVRLPGWFLRSAYS